MGHNKRYKSSHLLKHACESQHTQVWKDDFKILNDNYKSSVKRKISETLYIRTLKQTLNVKENQLESSCITLHPNFTCKYIQPFWLKHRFTFS